MKKRDQSIDYDATPTADATRRRLDGALNGALSKLRGGKADPVDPAADRSAHWAAHGAAHGAAPHENTRGDARDPTRTFFPNSAPFPNPGPSAGETAFSATAADDSRPGGAALDAMLEDSAASIDRRAATLAATANRLNARLAERAAGEVTLHAQGFRILVGFFWFGLAAWLYVSALNAQAAGDGVLSGALVDGMAVDDAYVLMRAFAIVAAAGIAVAIGIAGLTYGFGRGDDRKARAAGEALGAAIADDAHDFNSSLTELRAQMDRHAAAGDAVVDLSRAHMTALEACAYFRRLPFLTATDPDRAARQFGEFLQRPASGFSLFDLALGALLGFLLGAAYIFMAYVPSPEPAQPATPLAIMQYPWAALSLLLGGGAYAFAGVGFALIGNLIAADAVGKARAEALDGLNSAFTAREAPRPADVVRRINDAVDVFRARVAGARHVPKTATGAMTAPENAPRTPSEREANHRFGAADGPDPDSPPWRRRDSSVKFVETGFQAAPAQWRADPQAFFSEKAPGAKRSFFGLKNPFRG